MRNGARGLGKKMEDQIKEAIKNLRVCSFVPLTRIDNVYFVSHRNVIKRSRVGYFKDLSR